MTDRAKTIKALECCVANCKKDCPYWGHCHHDPEGVSLQFLEDALELLREQEPIEPIVVRVNELDSLFRCGGCGAYVLFRKQKYCHACGRKVDWNA